MPVWDSRLTLAVDVRFTLTLAALRMLGALLASRLAGPRALQLAQVLTHQPGHLEHGDFILSEDGLELGVRQDISLVLRVLQVIGLDVFPHELHNFGAGLRRCTDYSGQLGAGSEGTVECGWLLGSGHLRFIISNQHSRVRLRSLRNRLPPSMRGQESCYSKQQRVR